MLAWGEIGLDFYYDNSPRQVQAAAFAAQLQRAIACDVPVVIHSRDAEPETLEMLRRYPVPRGGHVHCFTGTPAMAEALLELGFYIGFTGIVSFPKAENVREALRVVPLERLLIETDSPYLAPMPHRGRRNEPAFVVHVAAGDCPGESGVSAGCGGAFHAEFLSLVSQKWDGLGEAYTG